MYAPGTILELKKKRAAAERKDRNDEVITDAEGVPVKFEFPYNRVQVIGESPIDHSMMSSAWEGAGARGVIITPLTDFGATLDEPFDKLKQLYNVVSIPTVEVDPQPKIRIIESNSGQAGPTPEEVFAEKAPGKKGPQSGRRTRTSPLGDVKTETSDGSPL